MASVTKPAEAHAGGKASGTSVIRSAGERSRQRLTGGSCTERFILTIRIGRNPWRRMEDARYPEEEILGAARSVARCWLMVGRLNDSMKAFKKEAETLKKKAEILMRTYGLTQEDVACGRV